MDKYFKAEQFHNRYIQLYEHFVVVTLIDGTTLEGLYNDDFYEDEAILISLYITVKMYPCSGGTDTRSPEL